jgi:hypothetical protein
MFTCKVFGVSTKTSARPSTIIQIFRGPDAPQNAKKLIANLTSIATVCDYQMSYYSETEIG